MSDKEVLIVVSKLKSHVKKTHNMSTAATVPAVLSEYVAKIISKAAENAQKDKRKTIMDRDFSFLGEA